jgi:hypothetical protein
MTGVVPQSPGGRRGANRVDTIRSVSSRTSVMDPGVLESGGPSRRGGGQSSTPNRSPNLAITVGLIAGAAWASRRCAGGAVPMLTSGSPSVRAEAGAALSACAA